MKSPAAAPARPKRSSRSGRRSRPLPTLPFGAFIAYADIPAARRAMGEIRDVLAINGPRCELRPMLWRFDQLAKENWRDISLRDAANASIVVLASTEPGLSPELERWLGLLMGRKQGNPITIVAVLGTAEAWTISIEKSEPARRAVAAEPRQVSTNRAALVAAAAA